MKKRTSNLNLKSASTVLGRKTFAAISAVEGLALTSAGRKRLASPLSSDQRRAEVLRAYLDIQGPK
jgi:hypothetical protein